MLEDETDRKDRKHPIGWYGMTWMCGSDRTGETHGAQTTEHKDGPKEARKEGSAS